MTNTEIRLEGAKKNIEKVQKTLERQRKTLENQLKACKKAGVENPSTADKRNISGDAFWAVCSYETTQENIANNEKKLAELNERLIYWEGKKKSEDKKNDVPRIPAVEKFLANWEKQAKAFYRSEVKRLQAWRVEQKAYKAEKMEELIKKYGKDRMRYYFADAEIKADMKSLKITPEYERAYVKKQFTQMITMLEAQGADMEKVLDREMKREVEFKRVDLYQRCSAVVGVIKDASGLKIGNNGSINGVVVGEDGKAYVETILAGGYNIQCLHYRVLVNPISDKKTEKAAAKTSKSADSQVEKKSDGEVSTFKGKSLQELEEMARELGATCKTYSDEKIQRMRLIMAIKKAMA